MGSKGHGSKVMGQRSDVMGQKLWVKHHRVKGQRSWDSKSWVRVQRSWVKKINGHAGGQMSAVIGRKVMGSNIKEHRS